MNGNDQMSREVDQLHKQLNEEAQNVIGMIDDMIIAIRKIRTETVRNTNGVDFSSDEDLKARIEFSKILTAGVSNAQKIILSVEEACEGKQT